LDSDGIRQHMKNKHKKAQRYKGKIKGYINIQTRYGETGDWRLWARFCSDLQPVNPFQLHGEKLSTE